LYLIFTSILINTPIFSLPDKSSDYSPSSFGISVPYLQEVMNVRYTNVIISYRWRSLFRHISRQESWATAKTIARCALYMGDISLSLFLVYVKWPRLCLWFKGCSDDRCDSLRRRSPRVYALHNDVYCRVRYRELFTSSNHTFRERSVGLHNNRRSLKDFISELTHSLCTYF